MSVPMRRGVLSGVLGAAADFLTDFLGHLLDDLSWNLIAYFLRDLHTGLLRDLLLHIYRVLSADSFGKVLALFSGNIEGNIFTLFLWYFLAFCSWHCFLHFLRHLLAMLLWNLKLK